jgi:hypothetical protein
LLCLIATKENEAAFEDKITQPISDALGVNYDPDDYLKPSGCPDGFCPLPGVRQGPSEGMFAPVCDD